VETLREAELRNPQGPRHPDIPEDVTRRLNDVNDLSMPDAFHVQAIDTGDGVPWCEPSQLGRAGLMNPADKSHHFHALLLPVVKAVSLDLKAEGLVLLLLQSQHFPLPFRTLAEILPAES